MKPFSLVCWSNRCRFVCLLWALCFVPVVWADAGQDASPPDDLAILGPTLSKIKRWGHIYIAHRPSSSPFSYMVPGEDGSNKVTGYSWEVCQHVIKAIEGAVGRSLVVVPVPSTANNRLMLVKAGMADLECGLTTNLVSRQKLVAFSNTFFVAEVKLLARTDGAIKSFSDLANKRVAGVLGGTAVRLVRQQALSKNIAVSVLETRNAGEAMVMLASGQVDAYAGDDAVLSNQRAGAKNPSGFDFLPDSLSVEPYGIVMPKDDDALRTVVNQALRSLMASGEMLNIYNKWFMSPIPPKGMVLNMPISPLTKSVFDNPNDFPGSN